MPQRSRARPSARRAPFLVLAGALSALALLAACGTVTPTGSTALIRPTSDNQPPSPTPPLGPTGAPGGSPTPGTGPTGSPTATPPPGPAIAWRRVAVPGVAATTERVAIGPNRIVVAVDSQAVDGTPTGHVAFWSSVDTVHWVAASHVPAADDGIVTAVAAFGRGFVAVGTDAAAVTPRVWTSADGRSWAASPAIATAAGATGAAMSSVSVGPDHLVAGGWVDVPGQRRAMAWVSVDSGQTWRPSIVDGSGPRAQVMSVAAGGPGWVATGIRDATAAFWLSRDGLAWVHVVPQPPVVGGFGAESSADGIACTSVRCVAVGQGPSEGDGWAWWSDTADQWNTVRPADALVGGASRTVAAFGGGFVAGGAGAAGLFGIWTTADGRHWTAAAHESGPVGIVGDLASDGTRIVAVGSPFDGGSGFAVWIGAAAS
jgi:hypothetical protein